ncbi:MULTISPECIES: hypothetical protein [unclassified Paenibacillus]|uniref:hypothetical protein n=1 Tax=unclassified Paenibacillus TaxID=185978 RepID=UPI0030F80C24
MDKLVYEAFKKLQKQEHLLKVIREQRGLGRITQKEFREREAEILDRYRLTVQEQRAYDLYVIMTQGRKRRK